MSDVSKLLGRIWGTGWHDLCSGTGKNESFRTDGHFDDVDGMLDAAAVLNSQRRNVWFGVHAAATKPGEGHRTSGELVQTVGVIVADLDWLDPDAHADSELLTEGEVRARLARFEVQPNVIVCSGHGLQPWWVFDAPVDVDFGSELIGRVHARLAELGLKPDRADLASVLRVPGLYNWKKGSPTEVVVERDITGSELLRPEFLDKYLPGATGWRSKGSKSGGVAEHGADAVIDKLRADGRDQDADVLDVLLSVHGGHHPWIDAAGVVKLTRPGKKSGIGATVGFIGPGLVKMFSANWPTSEGSTTMFKQQGRFGLNDAGDALEEMVDETFTDPSRPANVDPETGEITDADTDGDAGGGAARRGAPASWTDAHVGEAFGGTLLGRWLYCRALGGWLEWDGRRWRRDPGEKVFELCRRWVIDAGKKAFATAEANEMRQIMRYRDKARIDSVVAIARRLNGIEADVAEFDRHPYLLNCRNGVVDLRTGELGVHDPGLRLSKIAGAAYRTDATHPDWSTVLAAVPDNVAGYLQEVFGSAAVGKVVDDILVVFDGTGSNGKTTLLKGVSLALGEYASRAVERLLMARGVSDEHPTLLADLHGRRLVYIEETDEGGRLRMEQVKAITGGGALKARFIGKDYFEFEPTHTLIVATNHRPAVNASDYAAWRRLRLVPFTRTYKPADQLGPGDLPVDPGLRQRIELDAQRDAALAWVVAGAMRWHRRGSLPSCAEIDQASEAWRRDEDVIAAWWSDCVTVMSGTERALTPSAGARASDVYASYKHWCLAQGRRYVSSNKEFVKRLTDHDYYRQHDIEKRQTNTGASYAGLRVVDVVGSPVDFLNPPAGETIHLPTTSTTSRHDALETDCADAAESAEQW